MRHLRHILLGALLVSGSCVVPSSGPARYGYLGLASANIAAGSVVGLVMTCGLVDIVQGNKRRGKTKFMDQCGNVALGASVVTTVGGTYYLTQQEYATEPDGEDWATVSITGGAMALLGLVYLGSLFFETEGKVEDKDEYPAEDEYIYDDEGEESGREHRPVIPPQPGDS